MVDTTDGFKIAEVDLKLRGPGDLMGTQQSGLMDLMISDLGKDTEILKLARSVASNVLNADPDLKNPENSVIRRQVDAQRKGTVNWSRISWLVIWYNGDRLIRGEYDVYLTSADCPR